MSLYDYKFSQEIDKQDPPFYGLIMAAIRKADSSNLSKLKKAWPEIVDEFRRRYHAPRSILPEDREQL